MTKEQFLALKPGDKIRVEYTVKNVFTNHGTPRIQIAFADGIDDGTWPFDSDIPQNATVVTED